MCSSCGVFLEPLEEKHVKEYWDISRKSANFVNTDWTKTGVHAELTMWNWPLFAHKADQEKSIYQFCI